MKLGLVGAGRIGSTLAFAALMRGLFDEMALVDVAKERAEGESLDLSHAAAALDLYLDVEGGSDFSLLEGSDIVVISAGFPRTPDMSRMDLLEKNAGIVRECAEKVSKHAPDSIMIVITNPMDVMTYVAYRASGFEKNRVIGMGGALDSARFKSYLSCNNRFSARDLQILVLGEHGEKMLPLVTQASYSGIRLDLLDWIKLGDEEINRIKEIAREVIAKKGATQFGPVAATISMIESILLNQRRLFCCSVYLEGEFHGFRDVCMGVPVILGRNGVEEIVEVPLAQHEKLLLEEAYQRLRSAIEHVDKILGW